MLVRSLALLPLGLALLAPTVAWPCSPVPESPSPSLDGRVFAGMPLLLAPRPAPDLPVFRRVGGSTLALALSQPFSLSLAQPEFASPLALYTTSATLSAGQYQLGAETFTIVDDASGIDVRRVPSLAGTTMTLSLAGDASCAEDLLTIDLPAAETTRPLLYLLELEDGDRGDALRLVESTSSHLVFRISGQVQPSAERFCAKLTAWTWGGAETEELDLGCIDPALATDPRVVRGTADALADEGGCSTLGGAPSGVLPSAALVLLLACSRARRGRRIPV